jgi:diketogulonate reductase-like aldo/keto reductase
LKSGHLAFIFVYAFSILVEPLNGQTSLYSGYTKKRDGLIDDIPTITLSNGKPFPLIGLGVGNLPANRVENMVYEGIKAEHRIRMVDTAHASRNEKNVARGIVSGVRRFRKTEKFEDRVQVHVMTKVWYTHLGYERTKISVKESLDDLADAIKDPNVDLRVHVLIHWPRCYDTIPWMDCKGEEDALPDSVKKAGPPPHQDKYSWKESWKALEDMYLSADYPAIASIGVSNFGVNEMKELITMAREKPHITQLNIWSLIHDRSLVDICNKHNIHIQLYNTMSGILSNVFSCPHAHHHLLRVANMLTRRAPEENPLVKCAQPILKWLLYFGFSVIPRTSDFDNLASNSAVVLQAIPDLTNEELEHVAQASAALIDKEDMPEDVFIDLTFHASNQDMFLYYVAGEDNYQQIAFVSKGETYKEKAHPHQKFRMYLATDPDVYHDYTVEGGYGDHHQVRVEL